MTQQNIVIGTADAKSGDTLFSAFTKTQSNFDELYALSASLTVFITEESDFPAQDATTITLEDGTAYVLPGNLTVTKRFVSATNGASSFIGFGLNSTTLTFTGSGTLFSGVNASIEIMNISIEPGIANDLMNYSSSSPVTNSVVMDKVVVGDCASYGTFNNLFVVLMDNCSATTTTGLLFTGTIGILSLDRTNFTGGSALKGIDFNSAIFTISVNIARCSFIAPSGAFGLSGLTNSANIDTGLVASMSLCEFIGDITPLENISESDIRWEMGSNGRIPDSRNEADLFLDGGSETITTGSAGDWQEIGTPSGGGISWISDIAERFTIGTDGVITYIGERDISAQLSGRATVEKSGGGSNILEVRFAINWNGTASDAGLAKSRAQTQNTSPTTVPVGALVTLTENDNIRMIFSNTDGASDIIASVSSIEVSD